MGGEPGKEGRRVLLRDEIRRGFGGGRAASILAGETTGEARQDDTGMTGEPPAEGAQGGGEGRAEPASGLHSGYFVPIPSFSSGETGTRIIKDE